MAFYKLTSKGETRAQVYVNGTRESNTLPTKTLAKQWAAKRESELRDMKAGKFPRKTLGDALDRYDADVCPTKPRGQRWEILRVNAFRTQFKDSLSTLLIEIDATHLAAWRDLRLKSVAVGTMLREATILKGMFTIARKEWKWCDTRPFEDVKMPKDPEPRRRMAKPSEVRKICRRLGYKTGQAENKSQHTALIYLIALRTSMRSGEVVSLHGEQVDLKNRVVNLGGAYEMGSAVKNGHSRQVAITRAAARLLSYVWKPEGRLFDVSHASRDALFRKARDRAGVKDLHFHDSRRTAATNLSKKVGVLSLASITGHKDLKILQSTYYGETAAELAQRI